MKKTFLIAVALISGLAFTGLKLHLDDITRERIPGSAIKYLPAGEYLKYATMGYSTLAADLVYLWAIQYYSTPEITDRFDHLDHIFDIITDLDPLYLDAYEVGAIIAVYEAQDMDVALKILDKAIENNPDEWLFPFEAGHYAQWLLKDYRIAQKYYGIAMEIPGAPPQTKRLYANATFEIMDYETAWKTWSEVYNQAQDERTRKIAFNHLYRTRSAMDIENLEGALEQYRSRYGHFPRELTSLVQSGFLTAIPLDLDGKAYKYDPETGGVEAPSTWKR